MSAKNMQQKMSDPRAALGQFLSEVEKRAYELYLQRMQEGRHGSDLNDWLEAEDEVRGKYHL